MRVETVQVTLRPRSAWEAMELGNALVRRHARVIWPAWALVGLPVFALLNAAGWWFDRMWLAALATWWIVPALDRIPLFVLSRAVFGAAPSLGETLRAQRRWGWRALAGYLTWRRFSPWRAMALPVALLEGLQGEPLAQRRRVVVDGIGGHALLSTVIGHLFVLALVVSQALLVLLFVPTELLSESARAMWALLSTQPPLWAQLLGNLALWLALAVVAPFQVGAGFGLYLDRRTQLEAWDLEIAFRRARARLLPTVPATFTAVALAAMLVLAPPLQARPPPTPDLSPTRTWQPGAGGPAADTAGQSADVARAPTLPAVFGATVDDPGFVQAVDEAYADPLLDHSRTEIRWQRKDRDAAPPDRTPAPGVFAAVARVLATIAEFGLWVVLGLLVLALALTVRRWWPWMRSVVARVPDDSEIDVIAAPPLPAPLPDDLLATVRSLWQSGARRRALALLYRASVEVMAHRAGVALVPGATEAECLRAARRMPEADDRRAFADMVRVWQRAAYGQRLPDDAGFDGLLAALAPRFGWRH